MESTIILRTANDVELWQRDQAFVVRLPGKAFEVSLHGIDSDQVNRILALLDGQESVGGIVSAFSNELSPERVRAVLEVLCKVGVAIVVDEHDPLQPSADGPTLSVSPFRAREVYAVELVSDDPEALAGFYTAVLGVQFRRDVYGSKKPRLISSSPIPDQLVIHHRSSHPSFAKLGACKFSLEVESTGDLDPDQVLRYRGREHRVEIENFGLEGLPVGAYWDRWVKVVEDPDGNLASLRQICGVSDGQSERQRKLKDLSLQLRAVTRNLTVDSAFDKLDYAFLRSRNLRGMSHVVAGAEGLYAVNEREYRKLAHGVFFGVTAREDCLYCYQDLSYLPTKILGRPLAGRQAGRVLRMRIRDEKIVEVDVLCKGLSTNCHQIDFWGDHLFVVDTHCQRILEFDAKGQLEAEHYPLGDRFRDYRSNVKRQTAANPDYVHINSILRYGDRFFLLLHNGLGGITKSEIVETDEDFRVLDRYSLDASGAHDVLMLEDGELIVCDSRGGRLINQKGETILQVGELLARGLSADEHTLVVGESTYSASRFGRRFAGGIVHFYDREYRLRASLELPAAPNDLCRIDGRDLSLSNFRATLPPLSQ